MEQTRQHHGIVRERSRMVEVVRERLPLVVRVATHLVSRFQVWIACASAIGSVVFGAAILARPGVFTINPSYRYVTDWASIEAWGWTMVGLGLGWLAFIALAEPYAWVMKLFNLALYTTWMLMVIHGATQSPLGAFPIAAFVLSMINSLLLLHRVARSIVGESGART